MCVMVVIGLPCGPDCNKCESCHITADTFTRADDSDISVGSPCGWTTSGSGSSALASNACVLTGSNTLAICSVTDPGPGAIAVHAQVTFNAPTNGDIVRLILKHVDSSNYYYAQVTIGGSGTLRIYSRVSGTDTQLATLTKSISTGTHTLTFCYGEDRIVATLDGYLNAVVRANASTTINTQPGAGFSVGAIASAVSFTNFTFDHSYDAADEPDCDHCEAVTNDCGTYLGVAQHFTVPVTLQVVISGITGGGACTTFNGTFDLVQISHSGFECDHWRLNTGTVLVDVFSQSDGAGSAIWVATVSGAGLSGSYFMTSPMPFSGTIINAIGTFSLDNYPPGSSGSCTWPATITVNTT